MRFWKVPIYEDEKLATDVGGDVFTKRRVVPKYVVSLTVSSFSVAGGLKV